MMLGAWDVNVAVGSMPQKVATAFAEYFDKIVGAEYAPIAYLGSQMANGINHAILAEQVLVVGRDVKNIVLIIMNEHEDVFSVERIENIVAQGAPLGGIKINVETQLPAEAQKAWDNAFEGFVGSTVVPFAFLGTQMTKGTDYIFAATSEMIVRPMAGGTCMKFGGGKEVVIVTVRTAINHAEFKSVLGGKDSAELVGYSFTW